MRSDCISIGFNCQFKVELKDCLLMTIVGAFEVW